MHIYDLVLLQVNISHWAMPWDNSVHVSRRGRVHACVAHLRLRNVLDLCIFQTLNPFQHTCVLLHRSFLKHGWRNTEVLFDLLCNITSQLSCFCHLFIYDFIMLLPHVLLGIPVSTTNGSCNTYLCVIISIQLVMWKSCEQILFVGMMLLCHLWGSLSHCCMTWSHCLYYNILERVFALL